MKQTTIKMSEDLIISILEHSEDNYEIAVMFKFFPWSKWEIDYSKFDDVLKASSSMQVYGILKHIIEPAYYKITGWQI